MILQPFRKRTCPPGAVKLNRSLYAARGWRTSALSKRREVSLSQLHGVDFASHLNLSADWLVVTIKTALL